MIADHLTGINKFESGLWKIADNLRANSNLASNEYFMPILGLIFLRHATNRFYEAKAAIESDKAAGKMPDRPLVEADFTRRRALNLPENARFDCRAPPRIFCVLCSGIYRTSSHERRGAASLALSSSRQPANIRHFAIWLAAGKDAARLEPNKIRKNHANATFCAPYRPRTVG